MTKEQKNKTSRLASIMKAKLTGKTELQLHQEAIMQWGIKKGYYKPQ